MTPSKARQSDAASDLIGYGSLEDAQNTHPSCLEVNFCDLCQKSVAGWTVRPRLEHVQLQDSPTSSSLLLVCV